MKKVPAYEAATSRKRVIQMNFFQNTDPILFILFVFLFFDLLFQRGYQGHYIWKIEFKSVGLWGSYGLKLGNPLQNLKITTLIVFVLSTVLLFYLMYHKGY